MRTQRVALALTALNSLLLLMTAAGAFRPSALVAAASSPRASGPTPREVPILRGRALEIVDEHGKIRARLNVESDGEVVLRMTGRNGAIRVKLGAGEAGSGLLLADETTEPGVHIIARRMGTPARPTTTRLTLRAGTQERVISP